MSLPSDMLAIEIAAPGGPEVLTPVRRPVPRPGAGEILIRLTAAGVNRPDALQRAGNYAPPPDASDLPGLECAGHVAAVGPGASRWKEGDAVCALLPGGGYAEYAVTPAAHALPVPAGLSLLQAAALPETFFTVWSNVFMRAGLKAGERFLVHGGSSGIGTTAIQLARLFGARVFATAGTPDKCIACEDLGAERAVNYRKEDYVAVLREATGGQGIDVSLNMVGGDYIARDLRLLAEDGRLVMIAFLQGAKMELNLASAMMRRLTITGSTLRPQSVAAKAAIAAELEEKVWPLIAAGRLGPVMDETFPLSEAARAHARMESSAHIGKIVLAV
ncbi:NAD(P)H-quinone oxidoreductase [Halovulum dunhuangense]|uniref:NAD(P)H-quinone oxidoreductase n=1 Tax=Halovulum dunhuangense TaxID=1505036 RepID=A0A849L0A5_9RHOB|nr:NAD(P)H-quinone oxidoreductase [Halovulum dunhuangense]NNU79695.1 NAD(P)H-quinone oxidoreductase [Halovulum dunhuangense]